MLLLEEVRYAGAGQDQQIPNLLFPTCTLLENHLF